LITLEDDTTPHTQVQFVGSWPNIGMNCKGKKFFESTSCCNLMMCACSAKRPTEVFLQHSR
jgi:hypothetical protein